MSVVAAKGFRAGGLACGIKDSGAADLALVATADARPVAAAGVFTSNRVQAAPVQLSVANLADGRAAAVVLNSGNANAATGEPGLDGARLMAGLTAEGLGCDAGDVLVCSTGLIGIPLPTAPLEAGLPKLTAALGSAPEDGLAAAQAIMTTDTRPKEAAAAFAVDGVTVTVGGMAKGAAMLSPAMATMLCVVTTDAEVDARTIGSALEAATDASFHRISVDGCTSTNDTVLALAGGGAGAPAVELGSAAYQAFRGALTEVLESLAYQMVADAEGATKLVRVHVRGARSDEEARRAARQIADSLLVKCSFYGRDPYWGRVLSELGASGITLEPDRVSISYGGVTVCRDGVAATHDVAAAAAVMAEREIDLSCDLGLGAGTAEMLTNDLTHAYVDENMGTS